jgi:hypothetical protein
VQRIELAMRASLRTEAEEFAFALIHASADSEA